MKANNTVAVAMEISEEPIVEEMTVTKELLFVKEQNRGLLDPVKVVEFARNPDTVLHSKFEWDNTLAAEQHRIWQARQIIRMELIVIGEGKSKKKVRTFMSLTKDRKAEDVRGYREVLDILSDEDLTRQMLDEAKKDMDIFRRKYGSLAALAKVFAAMDEIV